MALRIARELRWQDEASALALEGLLLETLALVLRQRSVGQVAAPPWLRTVRALLHDCFQQPPSLSQFAATVGVNATHLAATFRRQYGYTAGEYVRQLRLEQAARELFESEKTLVEIADAAGFYDQSHFTRAFKQFTGMTPAQARALAQTPKAHSKSQTLSKPQ